ncbi:hypothetical protein G6F65_019991 [Rhizopus arrhizus]|nr:hypothetical protein G6F65_019991 [Rhizopus arrhizus]
MQPRVRAGRIEQLPHRRALVAQRQRIVRQIPHAHAAPARQRMIPAHHRVHRRPRQQFGLQAFVLHCGIAQCNLRQAFQDLPADLLGPLHMQMKPRLRPYLLEFGHAERQEAMGETFGTRQPDGDVAHVAALADLGGDALGFQRGGVGVSRKLPAGFAKRHAARLALEQHDAQVVFQLGDLAADG